MPSEGPTKGDAEHEHPRRGGTRTLMLSFPEGQLRRRTLKHLKRLCAPQRQLRRMLLPTEDTPPTMTRRLGAFLCNGFVQIGAWIECFLDHPRECMQAFEAVQPFGIAEFGCAQRSDKHLNGRRPWQNPFPQVVKEGYSTRFLGCRISRSLEGHDLLQALATHALRYRYPRRSYRASWHSPPMVARS